MEQMMCPTQQRLLGVGAAVILSGFWMGAMIVTGCGPKSNLGSTETRCDDQVDNDGDGMTDCEDPDCAAADGCTHTCGDGVCDDSAGETPTSCPEDCTGCGDGRCDPWASEDATSCPEDCASCGDGLCDASASEDATSCPYDCAVCGDGRCDPSGGESSTNCPQDCPPCALEVVPEAPQVITVAAGQHAPTVTFHATLCGNPVSVGWGVDRGEIGVVDAGPDPSTTFTPSGAVGGVATVYAALNNDLLARQVLVQLEATSNGPDGSPEEQAQVATDVAELTSGGGVGGVGGEGLGPPVTDPATLAALANPTASGQAQGLRLLYPYDQTVFPRGLLAPLLMWEWSFGDADAIRIELYTSSGSFSYIGTFGRPAILGQTGGAMIRHPIPQTAWTMATNTAGGATLDGTPDRLHLAVTIARNGVGYGPITQTWSIAPARLTGTIYYNSYGTMLAKNYPGAIGGDGMFGGAVLSIRGGDRGPQLAAGNNGTPADCRVCHSLAAGGSRLIAQTGNDYGLSAIYSVTPGGVTQQATRSSPGFPAITPDGAYALNALGELLDLANGGASVPVSGLDTVSTNLGTPAFSPAGDQIVFNPMAGPGITNPTQKLVVMDFDRTTFTFTNPIEVVDLTGSPPETRPGWPAFSPDGGMVIFQLQSTAGADGNGSGALYTRKGARAKLAWVPASGQGGYRLLDQTNGEGYLPQLSQIVSMSCTGDGVEVGNLDADHGDDASLNYEPTVNPIASGGYIWVVFTSRRMYGNLATIPPFCSDPRGVNLFTHITPKKLWVAAVDLNAPAGTDPSHPAFYLPGQELLAGNARGFWVLDPCRADGEPCETGDQCCNGFCSSPGGDPTAPRECTDTPSNSCSGLQEACDTAADCCDPTNLCINGFCSLPGPG